jgi:nucleoid DNA-binding protein
LNLEGIAMADNKATKTKPATKTATYADLAERTGLSKKDVAKFFDELGSLIKQELSKKGPGVFNIPGLIKIKRVEKPATKARKGRNPQTGEEITIKAKPKRTIVKALALKALKEMVK